MDYGQVRNREEKFAKRVSVRLSSLCRSRELFWLKDDRTDQRKSV